MPAAVRVAIDRCSEIFQIKMFKSVPELARRSAFEGCQLMEVIVFLCSDMIDSRRNSLKCLSSL